MADDVEVMILGCGNMGAALASGFHAANPGKQIIAIDPDVDRARRLLSTGVDIEVVDSFARVESVKPRALVIALKPQVLPSILPQLAARPAAQELVISIAAGTTGATLKAALPAARIVRGMPNTPAAVGAGASVLWADAAITPDDRAFCEAFFGTVGSSHWVEHESLIDSATAVSGSGPAYFFAVVEAMQQAARDVGLPPDLAAALPIETMAGAAAMLRRNNAEASELKAAVRSPAGTTNAALNVFEKNDVLAQLVLAAIRAAHARAQEMRLMTRPDPH